MSIITSELFKAQTAKRGLFAGKARGSNLIHVDHALENYWALAPGAGVDERVGAVAALIAACEKWLKKKSGKTKHNELFLRRRYAVLRLGNGALAELYALRPEFRARIEFSKNKMRTLAHERHHQTKSLSAGYAHERTAYLAAQKTYAPSGSDLHTIHRNVDKMGGNAAFARKMKAKSFEQLSFADFQTLHKLGKSQGFGEQVDFLKKGQRTQYLAIPDGGVFRGFSGNLYNAPNPPDPAGQFMYAIDEYGNLFSKNPDSTNRDAVYFNHSSFNAGKNVISAGMIKIRDGKLLQIDNNSGHYKPTRDNLHEAIQLFNEEEIDLGQATVLVYEFTRGQQMVHAYRAAAFLSNKNAPADLGLLRDQDGINAFLRRL